MVEYREYSPSQEDLQSRMEHWITEERVSTVDAGYAAYLFARKHGIDNDTLEAVYASSSQKRWEALTEHIDTYRSLTNKRTGEDRSRVLESLKNDLNFFDPSSTRNGIDEPYEMDEEELLERLTPIAENTQWIEAQVEKFRAQVETSAERYAQYKKEAETALQDYASRKEGGKEDEQKIKTLEETARGLQKEIDTLKQATEKEATDFLGAYEKYLLLRFEQLTEQKSITSLETELENAKAATLQAEAEEKNRSSLQRLFGMGKHLEQTLKEKNEALRAVEERLRKAQEKQEASGKNREEMETRYPNLSELSRGNLTERKKDVEAYADGRKRAWQNTPEAIDLLKKLGDAETELTKARTATQKPDEQKRRLIFLARKLKYLPDGHIPSESEAIKILEEAT